MIVATTATIVATAATSSSSGSSNSGSNSNNYNNDINHVQQFQFEFSARSSDEWDIPRGTPSTDDNHSNIIHTNHLRSSSGDNSIPSLRSSSNDGASTIYQFGDQRLPTKRGSPSLKMLEMAFLLISFGYMLPWTSLGSLISYYKLAYSANFYVKLYCAYYFPGLPVALMQMKYDYYFDLKYGASRMFLWRGLGSFVCMILILISMVWIRNPYLLVFMFVLLGICGWLCHGTASMLASMYPATAITYLQTGFRCPEIYTISAVAVLQLGREATQSHLVIFYILTAVVVSVGMFSWLFVVTSSTSMKYFELKDTRMQSMADTEKLPLIGISQRNNINSSTGCSIVIHPNADASLYEPQVKPKFWLKANHDVDSMNSMKTKLYNEVLPLCFALIITIWCSIFQASFYAYVDSPKGRDIEQILYFVRLFADLLGRPLARFWRPWYLRHNHQVLMGALFRIALMLLFFAYLFIDALPRSDLFACILVGSFSILSGYFTVLIYEYASHDGLDGAAQIYATQLLNISFQIAAFTAVFLSVIITSTGWIEKML